MSKEFIAIIAYALFSTIHAVGFVFDDEYKDSATCITNQLVVVVILILIVFFKE